MKIQAVGIDLAMANMGLARVTIEMREGGAMFEPSHLQLVETEGRDKKTVRKSSDDFRRAQELQRAMRDFCQGAQLAIVEVPHGSQSARASWCLGIAVGVLASCPIPVIEVSSLEVKLASVGRKTATKTQMIQWGHGKWPGLQWLYYHGKLTAANEHLADALATIAAGIKTSEFLRLLSVMPHAATSPALQRPPLHSEPRHRVSLEPMDLAPRAVRRRID